MSVPKKRLYELIDQIPDENNQEVVEYLEQFVQKKQEKFFDPEKYFGILKDWDINVEEECKKMRKEWDHRGWDAISD
jgi:hypothetical protein